MFAAAGVYNIGWGIWAAIDPQWLFRVTAVLIWRGTWPFAAGIICVTNDLMWWPPFVLPFMTRGRRSF